MSYNDRKIAGILLQECQNIKERCPGYRDAIIELIGDVLSLERDHTIRRINIEQKIGDKVSAAGQYLYKNRDFTIDE